MQERKAKLKTQLIILAFTVGAVAFVWWAGPTRLSANPLSWTTEVNLSQTSNTTDPHPDIDAQDQTVYAVWIEQVAASPSTAYDPLYKKSTDGGVTWASSVNISSSTSTRSDNVSVAIDGNGKPHFVWAEREEVDYDIYYRYDTNSPHMIKDTDPWDSVQPDVVVANSTVHVVWADSLSAILYVSKTVAANWNNPMTENVSAGTGELYSVPDMAVGGDGVVHAVWAEYTAGNQFVYYNRRSTTTGWGTPTNLISPTHYTSGVFDYPAIAISGTNSIYLIYSRNAFDQGQQYVDFMKSIDGGVNWSTPTIITGPLGVNTVAPSNIVSDIAVDDQGIRAVWSGTLGGTNEIIFYGHSTDEGATWTIEQVTTENYNRTTPAIDVAQGTVHLVWARGLPTLRNAFYSRSGQSGSGGGVYLPVILKNYP